MLATHNTIKTPNVSGQFYEADPIALAAQVDEYLKAIPTLNISRQIPIIFVPHAGYLYSGAIAAHAFKAIEKKRYRTIVILAPSHYIGFDGLSVWDSGAFETPLGTIPVDQAFSEQLVVPEEGWEFYPTPFLREHSLEVLLPFLQRTFVEQTYAIVPVIMGQPSEESVAKFADRLHHLIGEREDVLLIVSSDLSHYHNNDNARTLDQHTIALLEAGDVQAFWEAQHAGQSEMCGDAAAATALGYAKRRGWPGMQLLQYTHSGEITGDPTRVVGYMAGIITVPRGQVRPLTETEQDQLLDLAYHTLDAYIRTQMIPKISPLPPRLNIPEGAFITLYHRQRLRGCIGIVVTENPLCETVRDMTIAAATQDNRFSPISFEELPDIEIEISVLSIPERITTIEDMIMGKHGILINKGDKRGVFLPQVANTTGWSKEELLSKLCMQKACIPASSWREPAADLQIFTSMIFSKSKSQLT